MKQLTAQGIVLTRTNFGEADRIVTFLTPASGKLHLVARGVRRPKSKIAGGIELFSVSSLTYITGRGDLGRLISSRLDSHYGNIIKRIDRVQLGYDSIKMIHRATEDDYEPEYFTLLTDCLAALNDDRVDLDLIRLWLYASLLQLAGQAPNMYTDATGQPLQPRQTYTFDFDSVSLSPAATGRYTADHIKFLRLALAGNQPFALRQITGYDDMVQATLPLLQTLLHAYIRQ